MIIVCNSTMLIALARINMLTIIERLINEIYIPDAVYEEVVIDGKGMPGSKEIEKANWIRKVSINDKLSAKILQKDLGKGESEAIVLAQEISADYVILYEIARKTAEVIGLRVIGTLGILSWAYKKKIISDLKKVIDKLIDSGFYISNELYQNTLRDFKS